MINKNSRFYLQETSMRWTEEWTSTEYMIVRSELKMWMHPSVRNACITGCTDGAVWSVEIVLFLTLRWMQLSPSPIFRVLDWASDEIHRHHKSINISLQRGYPGHPLHPEPNVFDSFTKGRSWCIANPSYPLAGLLLRQSISPHLNAAWGREFHSLIFRL